MNTSRFALLACTLLALSGMARTLRAQEEPTTLYDMDLKDLSRVQISSATKIAQSLSEIPATVHVITAEDIRVQGYLTLDEALQDLPGFQFRNILGINSYAFQRGVPNQNNLTLVLIDGVQVNELNSGGFYGGGQYNLDNVDRIEIVQGPASVVYGTNAVAGIINIITRDALTPQTSAGALVGSFNTYAAHAQAAVTNEARTFGVRLAAMLKNSDKADLKGKAGDGNWSDRMENGERDYALDLKIQCPAVTLGASLMQKQTTTATQVKGVGSPYRDYGTLWNIRFFNASARYSGSLSPSLTLSSTLYHRNTTVLDNSIYWVLDTARIGYYRPNHMTGWESVLDLTLGEAAACTGGLTLEFESLARNASMTTSAGPDLDPPTPPAPDMVHTSTISLFVEPRLRLASGLSMSGGLRFDHSSVYDNVLTPRLGLSYVFGPSILRLSYAEAFRAPKPWDYSDGIGNPSLDAERMRSLETSFGTPLFDDLRIEIAAYVNHLEGAFIRQTTAQGSWWDNAGMVKTQGLEFTARYHGQGLNASVNYTYTNSRNEAGSAVDEISPHTANLGIIIPLIDPLTLSLRGNFTGERPNPSFIPSVNSSTIAASFILHATLTAHDVLGCTIQLSVRNLLDTEYYHSSNRDPERYRQPQRGIRLSATWSL